MDEFWRRLGWELDRVPNGIRPPKEEGGEEKPPEEEGNENEK